MDILNIKQIEKQMDKHINKYKMDRYKMDKQNHTVEQTDRQTDGHTKGHTDGQTDKQTG